MDLSKPLNQSSYLRELAKNGLITIIFANVIAIGLTLAGNQRWDIQLAYVLPISMITWILIDLGRVPLSRGNQARWPHGALGHALVAGSVFLGYLLGTAIGDWYCGCSTWELITWAPRRFASYLVLTAAAALVAYYYRYASGRARSQMAELAIAQRDAAQARLKLLQSQLEPHMLFNTLASLRVLIQTDSPQALPMLDALNRFLRSTLSASRQTWHPLSAEFDRLRDYLELMSMRMGKRLQFDLQLPIALAEWPVPPLLLQPLVENSIRHGLEPSVSGGKIQINALLQGDGALALEVFDTGLGLVQPPASNQSFGLEQVRARLLAAYGTQASFALTGNLPHGTIARIVLPKQAALEP